MDEMLIYSPFGHVGVIFQKLEKIVTTSFFISYNPNLQSGCRSKDNI